MRKKKRKWNKYCHYRILGMDFEIKEAWPMATPSDLGHPVYMLFQDGKAWWRESESCQEVEIQLLDFLDFNFREKVNKS